ncbi:hypothetical protein M9H77_11497 [Catharanthus roseus]|uniref:Uncharacterized protein n=1 Tax=Catharanthus roseus TaxID=4058 RepID=A0ACC0BET0_CATRO|nr:hypothetical protein M9H77_11497 [Catharanthus roseus]
MSNLLVNMAEMVYLFPMLKNALKSKDFDLQKENKSHGENLSVRGRVDRGGHPSHRFKSKGQSKSREKNKVKYFYCGKEDHMKNKCFKRIKDEKQRKHGKGSNKIDKTHDFDLDGNSMFPKVLCASLSTSCSKFVDHWVLESGCSFHMIPNKHWFSDFKPLNQGKVFMGNN